MATSIRWVRTATRIAKPLLVTALISFALWLGACAGDSQGDTAPDASATSSGSGGAASACSDGCPASTPHCDETTGTCRACLDDSCPDGQYCDKDTDSCVGCLDDSHCPDGVCVDGNCVKGCVSSDQCDAGESCCNGGCIDLSSDLNNCGACGAACPSIPHASTTCTSGQCLLGSCDAGWIDCNQNVDDGCEWDLSQGECTCTVGTTTPCYTGPIGTEGKGECKSGIAHCLPDGSGWAPCGGQVVPSFDWCDDGLDNDCDGTNDNPPDEDGDGWSICEGDCCDSIVECGSPELVNPGAFEVAGNMLDDDCDGQTDNVLGLCDNGLASDTTNALDFAKSIDLCRFTTDKPASPKDRTWGVIGAKFKVAQGGQKPSAESHSIRGGFGTNVTPQSGSNMAVLSSGVAAAQDSPNNTQPDWQAFQPGVAAGKSSNPPQDWLMANGGKMPNSPGCPEPAKQVNDSIMLELDVRVPTNANSFKVSTFFYSSEYPEWVCSQFNDFFLTLLDSKFVPNQNQSANPSDKNIAFYDAGGGNIYPLGVNLAFGNTGLFKQCENGQTGCNMTAVQSTTNACTGTTMLAGTGFDIQKPPSPPGLKCCCGNNDLAGGGTGWLKMSGNVKPGETIKLRFVIWDTSDAYYDSLVLLDGFEWSVSASTPGVSE